MGSLFKDTVRQIERFCEERDYRLGWRFLTCSRKVLDAGPKIALVTLNPAGGRERPDHPSQSCEEGCAYLIESWKDNLPPGKAPLQIQVQRMFAEIAKQLDYRGTPEELLEESLSGYFVPFRSPSFEKLEHRREALVFGETIWSRILESARPQLIICIDKETCKRVRKLIPRVYGLEEASHLRAKTGWGDYEADIVEFGESSEARLLRLPHLSRFGLFGNPARAEHIDHIFTRFCGRES